MEALHDVRSAAKLLGVSPWTVRAKIRQGTLVPIRIGRLVRFEEKELVRFVASSKTTGGSLLNPTQSGEQQ